MIPIAVAFAMSSLSGWHEVLNAGFPMDSLNLVGSGTDVYTKAPKSTPNHLSALLSFLGSQFCTCGS